METEKSYLADINPNTPPASIKLVLKLLRKKNPITTEGKNSVQAYNFIDERGTRRRAVTFSTNVDFLDRHLTTGRAYEIKNVIIKKVDQQYKLYPGELQLNLTRFTRVRLLDPATEPVTFTPTYVPLSQFPAMFEKAPFDIIVAVTKVEPPHQVTLLTTGLPVDIANVCVADDSVEEIVQLSAWRALAERCQEIAALNTPNNIATFTCIKTIMFEGRPTLATTYDTKIDMAPSGTRAAALKQWSASNNQILKDKMAAFEEHQPTKKDIVEFTLAAALRAQPAHICKGDLIRVMASVKAFDNNSPRSIFTCPRCSHPYFGTATQTQQCETCTEPSLCTAKLFIDFTAVDGETTYGFQAHPRTAEKLLGITALEFHNKKPQEKAVFVADAIQSLKTKRIPLILTPCETRLDYAELQWELKYIARE